MKILARVSQLLVPLYALGMPAVLVAIGEKERLRLERDAARRELEALKAQLAAQSSPA